ncbi:hypothetical protein HPB52_009896 [Rhipicephalus sanguineus]|uniref:Uncharacterized protein n=1 Tax=Rhipicephalus sanguineus TaxID=34632 RepID=A0A9D4Q9I6_RHISA|nr:hypothetical protein HPB52_009896 [Rhipicephalus sanguineus]
MDKQREEQAPQPADENDIIIDEPPVPGYCEACGDKAASLHGLRTQRTGRVRRLPSAQGPVKDLRHFPADAVASKAIRYSFVSVCHCDALFAT